MNIYIHLLDVIPVRTNHLMHSIVTLLTYAVNVDGYPTLLTRPTSAVLSSLLQSMLPPHTQHIHPDPLKA